MYGNRGFIISVLALAVSLLGLAVALAVWFKQKHEMFCDCCDCDDDFFDEDFDDFDDEDEEYAFAADLPTDEE